MNVVFIVVDTLRKDRVSLYGCEKNTTPAIDSFAEEATVYEDAVAQGTWSIPSHASLFTGDYPFEHNATAISPYLSSKNTLANKLRKNGYNTYALSTNEYVRPLTGLDTGFENFELFGKRKVVWPLAQIAGRAISFLSKNPRIRRPIEKIFNAFKNRGSDDKDVVNGAKPVEKAVSLVNTLPDPYFLFINLTDAHLPRSPEREYEKEFVQEDLKDVEIVGNERIHNLGKNRMNERQIKKLKQMYDADVRTADQRVKPLLRELQSEDHEDTMVVLMSDHGESLGEFGMIGHQHNVFDGVITVPLIIRYPGQKEGRTVSEQVETRRVFHTILDETGIESFGEKSLREVNQDRPAFGEFYTPMMDLQKLFNEGNVDYDVDLIGEKLSFVRDNGWKVVNIHGEERLYRTPEYSGEEQVIEENTSIYKKLKDSKLKIQNR